MARPKQTPDTKGVYTSVPEEMYFYRNLVPFANPEWMDGNRWRIIARSQPVVMDVISSLTMYIHGLPWDIRAKDPKRTKELENEIKYHIDVFNSAQDGAGILPYMELLLEDFNMIPFGAGTETVRYKPNRGDLDPRGKLYKILSVDGATFFPANDPTGNVVAVQVPPYSKNADAQNIVFNKNELVRMYRFPRPELIRRGWGMPPLERVFLAVELLSRGDKYYANLLLDTPEAGILDLGDMTQESAEKWISSARIMFSGLEPFKVPVIAEHTTPVKWIPFGRPPSELLYNETYEKYAQLVTAAYGLTLSDIGWRGSSGNSLAGAMREDRKSRATGYATVRKYLETHFSLMLPNELVFKFIDIDDEALAAKGRARSANAVAGRNLIEAGIFTPLQWSQQMVADGLVTIPIENDEPKIEDFEVTMALKNGGNAAAEQAQGGSGLNAQRDVRGTNLRDDVMGKEQVPASSGGMGTIKRASVLDTTKFRELIYSRLLNIITRASRPRLKKLMRLALRNAFPVLRTAFTENSNVEGWRTELMSFYLGDNSVFAGDEIVERAANGILENLNPYFEKDRWWTLEASEDELADNLVEFYARGLLDGAKNIQEALYETDIVDSPEIPVDINRDDLYTDRAFRERMGALLGFINSGTIFYMKRLASATVLDENILETVKSRVTSGIPEDNILADDAIVDAYIDKLLYNMGDLFRERANSIAEMESTEFYNIGLMEQARRVGIKTKSILHVGSDEPCEECLDAIKLGMVEIDFEYKTKMGTSSRIAPFHPDCHCKTKFHVGDISSQPKYYTGE